MGVEIATMKANWERVLPNLLKFFKEEKIPCMDEGTEGKQPVNKVAPYSKIKTKYEF